jgi:predicted dehydrogenase
MVNCAIVGCGRIAGGYDVPHDDQIRTHAKAYMKNPDCQLVGVCDSDFNLAQRFAEIWGADQIFTNIEELLKECKPDILSVCTPNDMHERHFLEACKAGVPVVWMEKPAASSLSEVERMISFAEISDTRVWVNYFRRYEKGFRDLSAALASLGKLQNVRAMYTKGLRNNGSHMLDLIDWFFGPIHNVDSVNSHYDSSFPSASVNIETERAIVELRALDYNEFEIFELDIIGVGGRVTVVDGGQEIRYYQKGCAPLYDKYNNLLFTRSHSGTYPTFMGEGLSRGLAGEAMPDLQNELKIQQVIEKISTKAQYRF